MIIVDAHQDIAYNMLTFGRDYTLAAEETRRREKGTKTPARNGDTLLGWPEFQRGQVAVIFATLFVTPARKRLGEWESQSYATMEQASALYRGQLDAYARLADDHPDKFRLISDQASLEEILAHWDNEAEESHPVGLVMLMEGAEGVRDPGELEEWWERGVRVIGPAWAGTRFCGGTGEPGPLTKDGFALLEGMAECGFALDVSHMDEPAVLQALDFFPGTVIASHSNARALLRGVESNRNLTDRMLRGLLEREGVIGIVPANGFLRPGWSQTGVQALVTLEDVVAQIDYICQMAGSATHVGLGSDYDGGFGLQSVPAGIDTIADLQKLVPLLLERGYGEVDAAAIMGQNWLAVLRRILPEG